MQQRSAGVLRITPTTVAWMARTMPIARQSPQGLVVRTGLTVFARHCFRSNIFGNFLLILWKGHRSLLYFTIFFEKMWYIV
jgi:hypothetical protein